MTGRGRPWELPLSEAELTSLTRGLDEAHRGTIPSMFAQAREMSRELADTTPRAGAGAPARRGFLLGAGVAVAAAALAACGKAEGGNARPEATPTGAYPGGLKVVALSAALENQAVDVYRAVLSAAQAGKLGTVPPAVATFADTALSQHADHANAWNSVLQQLGKPPVKDIPLAGQKAVATELGKVTDVGGAAKLALRLEDQATQTYVSALSTVANQGGIAVAAAIAPVEAMHAAILHYMLGEYPVPADFIGTGMAAKPSDLTV